jgi:hypothetical protein
MTSASVLRLQIESTLAQRIPSALTPAPKMIRPLAATGIEALDDALQGGLPIGAISELAGPECSGRSSVAFSFLAQTSRMGKSARGSMSRIPSIRSRRQRQVSTCPGFSGSVAEFQHQRTHRIRFRTTSRFQKNTSPLLRSRKDCMVEVSARIRAMKSKGSRMRSVAF